MRKLFPDDGDASGHISRVIIKNGDDRFVTISNPEVIKVDADFERASKAFVLFDFDSDSHYLADKDWVAIPKYGEIGDDLDPEYEKIEANWRSKIEELTRHDGKVAQAYANLLAGLKMVSAFREKPHEIHEGGTFRNSGYATLHHPDKTINPEGRDLIDFVNKYGADLMPADNPMFLVDNDKVFDEGDYDNSKCTTLLKQIQLWLDFVSPGARIHTESIKVGGSEQIIMSVCYGENAKNLMKFKPQNVGFGISYVLPVLVTLLVSSPNDIVIIENPEAHLHPRGQSAMGNLLARAAASGIQLFVETHSDHVINGIRVAVKKGIVKPKDVNIAFFERVSHDVKSADGVVHKEYYAEERDIKIDSKGALSEYPEDFMDEWDNQLMELLK